MDISSPQSSVRERVWDRLREFARPDSRLHFDFAHMHPDFDGSDAAAERLLALWDGKKPLEIAFSAPDGALLATREQLLRRGTKLVISTFCMRRGFRLLDPARLAATDIAFAATLDGLERFGEPIDVARMATLGRLDLVLTGTAAVSPNGVRFGRSYQYFDIEWGILTELGLVRDATPVAVVAHDVQVAGDRIMPRPREVVPDYIATPTRLLRVESRPARPHGIDWDRIDPDELELMPSLVELQRARGLRR